MSKDIIDAYISDDNYRAFLEVIKEEIRKREENPIKLKDTTGYKFKSYVLLNPEGNYYHHIDVNFGYTYYKTFYFSAGTNVFFGTNTSLPMINYPHVIEFFNKDDPENKGSWVAYNQPYNNWPYIYENHLSVTIPYSGYYYLRVRAYIQGVSGIVDLYKDFVLYVDEAPVTGMGFSHPHTTPTTYNYFTCKLTGDSRIWIEDYSGLPGKIRAWNDDYSGGGDFYWGLASRVKKDFSVNISAALISSYSSYNPTGTCDLYIKCKNSGTLGFPNLKSDDAIQSANTNNSVYNCISWSGGITDHWEWPLDPFSEYYVPGNPLASFDNFYAANPRYGYEGEAMTYSRSGATSSNSVVDLWYNPNYYGIGYGSYAHGSVNKPGNNHPHGYDWESKPGPQNRIFHPRNSLNSTAPGGYGYVSDYYKPTSSLKSAMLLDESIARGHSVIENVELTAAEKTIVSESINALSTNQRNELENKYITWKKTWEKPEITIQSNPRMYAISKEYDEFIDYCIAQGKAIWPFIFDKFQKGDFFVINVLEDLTLEENQNVLEKVKKESSLKSTTETGAFIVRSPQAYAMKYIKELLKSSNNITSTDEEGITYSNSFDFKVYPNPVDGSSQLSFKLATDAKVSAHVIDLNGRVLSVVINEQVLTTGNQNFSLNIPENFKGTCLVKLLVNNNVNVQLIVVQ